MNEVELKVKRVRVETRRQTGGASKRVNSDRESGPGILRSGGPVVGYPH